MDKIFIINALKVLGIVAKCGEGVVAEHPQVGVQKLNSKGGAKVSV